MTKEFHHVGLPTDQVRPNEIYLADIDLYITDAGVHPHRVEWVRRGPKCTLPEILGRCAHVAYAVDDLEAALNGQQVIVQPWEVLPGLTVSFILDNEAPVEFLQFKK
jgi:hypothetical protein